MGKQIVTSDPKYLKRIGKYQRDPLPQQQTQGLCPLCGKPKKQHGRMFVCTCTGKAVRMPSGKNIKRNQKF